MVVEGRRRRQTLTSKKKKLEGTRYVIEEEGSRLKEEGSK